MNLLKRFCFLAVTAVFLSSYASAAIPSGYYDSCEGKTGEALLNALYSKIKGHTVVSYKGLWTLYKTSDTDSNGKIWDMYSTKRWTYASEQCGNYSSIGDCYNREHSFPKSWFDDASPMYSDAFHLYPTDGWVNSKRSNLPFGECANAGSLAASALGKIGTSTFPGYSGTVFEPDNQYKGDFARSYFYMAARYSNECFSWPGSEMINNTSYPFFTSWATDMLLKWTRQDEVSQKELDRQEAVYAAQHNRNPFIDHPELAEYIWGDKKGQPWHSGAAVEPDILQPILNTEIDLGVGAVNRPISQSITVKTRAIEEGVVLSTYPANFSVSPTWIDAADADAGTTVTITCTAATAGTFLGTLSIAADNMEREVDMKATIVDGLPIYDASDITSESFVVRWMNIGDAPTYTLDVRQGSQSIPGYPKSVDASAETYTVTGLDPETEYTYQLSSATISSEIKTVTTGQLVPSIEVLFDGTLHFDAAPGVPSSVAELLLDIENVSEAIVISVKTPFEISTDKASWATSVALDPEEDRFYMRVNSPTEGSFSTSIAITAGDYMTDDAEASATVTDPAAIAFFEDWEKVENPTTTVKTYSTTTFQGTASLWHVENGGFGTGTQDKNFNKTTAMRMGDKASCSLSMAENKAGGVGVVTFDAAKWANSSEPAALIDIDYSNDNGATWETIGSVTVSESASDTYSVAVNRPGEGRIRFIRTSGKRWFIDNISISNYTEINAIEELEYHSWDAFCRGGRLIIECRDKAEQVAVYSIDGITWISGLLAAGQHEYILPKGLYIVVSGDFARRVLIK